jgi:hypothetical protein
MEKFLKFVVTFLLLAMTASAIFLLISEPKDLGAYASAITCTFFDVIGYLAMYHKKNKIYIALHDPWLGEEKEND